MSQSATRKRGRGAAGCARAIAWETITASYGSRPDALATSNAGAGGVLASSPVVVILHQPSISRSKRRWKRRSTTSSMPNSSTSPERSDMPRVERPRRTALEEVLPVGPTSAAHRCTAREARLHLMAKIFERAPHVLELPFRVPGLHRRVVLDRSLHLVSLPVAPHAP